MLAIDSPYDVACRDASGVRDVQHLDSSEVKPVLVDAQLCHQAFASPVIAMSNVLDGVSERVNRHGAVLVADVSHNIIYKPTRTNGTLALID
jgi:hypothetical protein